MSDLVKRVATQFLEKRGCLVNDPASLPEIGSVVERIVMTELGADIYFQDGSWVSANLTTSVCSCGGCKTASEETLDMVAVVRDRELLGAKDITQIGARDAAVWQFSGIAKPFALYRLRSVPLSLAEALVDFGTPASRLRDGHKAWRLVSKFAGKTPFKQV